MPVRSIFGPLSFSARLPLGLALSLLLLCLWTVPPALSQNEGLRVDKVEIQGLAGYKPQQILYRLKTEVGKKYSSIDARNDLAELSKVMRTAAVQTKPSPQGGVIVFFVVSEFPRFHKLQVIGNQRLKTARIEGIAKLKAGDVVDENVQRSLLKALRAEYKVLGMPQARVTLNLIDVPPAQDKKGSAFPQADLQIVVDEGRQILADDVIIKGNHAFARLRLRFYLETKGSWLFIKNYYDDETFKEDLKHLQDFYVGHGYFDARVERGIFNERAKGEKVVVSPVIQITEGERYRFGKARVRGAKLFSEAELVEPFKKLEGRPFDGREFGEALDKLRAIYQDHGLVTTQFDPRSEPDPQAKVFNTTIEINEKDRIYVGKIKLARPAYQKEEGWFRGWYERVSPPVKDETVLREVLLKPGDIYNKQLERDSLRRLARLHVFDNDTLKAYNEPTGEPGVHNMVIEAHEALTGALSGGVGFGDATGAFLFGSITERNVGGEANVFSFEALLGQRASSASLSYLDRHLRDTDNSLQSRLYYDNLLRPGYRARIGGATSELGHPLANNWTAYLRGRLEMVKLTRRTHRETEEDLNRSYPVATAQLRFEQDTRYPLGNRPREGHWQSYGAELGYAGGPLLRFEAARDQYFPVTEKLTYRLNAFAGLMPYDAQTVPIHERYFLGGNTDMRGFQYRGAGYFDSKDDRAPIGGAAKILVKNELLFPIIDPVSGVLFADVGLLGKSPVSWQAPRVSVGPGLRFDLKNVQVALDAALPVLKQPDDQTRYFHFSLQSQF